MITPSKSHKETLDKWAADQRLQIDWETMVIHAETSEPVAYLESWKIVDNELELTFRSAKTQRPITLQEMLAR